MEGKLIEMTKPAKHRQKSQKTASNSELVNHILNALGGQISDHIYFKDTESRFIWMNRALARYLGLSEPEEAFGKSDDDFFSEEHAKAALKDEQDILQTHRTIQKDEKETWNDKPDSWVSTVKMPFYHTDGTLIGTFGISRDITEKKRIENALVELNREMEAFTYMVSHDLQEPLRKIIAFGDLLQLKCANTLSEEGEEYLTYMQDAARRMKNLINALLSYSRISLKEKEFKDINLNVIIDEVIEDLQLLIDEKQGRIIHGNLPQLQADPAHMHQLFQNLIGNALKFHQPDVPPLVEISAREISKSFCEISVKDNGIGFDPAQKERVFGVFQRLHPPDRYSGTGIGLSVCRKIAEQYQGSIDAESNPGKGTTFFIRLPWKQT